ncbi:SDR family NAD(P)-dependent oxidoreductase [Microbacterium terrisoli]|jgi:3-oxoacyl-[acyl-carrier protein] reductase|uniref:SDR family NAD(P)-dependent oxidoreductase n=1 Tax=Microbacterium terrisoli TaxID=3242192 RepID=UPI0028051950|nr:SDR family NAD(P)-dependent oxidoreductase [Microbacterium protaetiae]
MHIDLSEKVAIVTGAARGIGKEICLSLAREGVIVVALDVTEAALASTAHDLHEIDPRARTYACDIRDAARIDTVIADAVAALGRIDILVNNAGVVDEGVIETVAEARWDLVQDVNVKGTFLMCKAVIPVMKRQRSGRIINAASFAAIVPRVGGVVYAASKAAVVQLTRGLAGELGPWEITVNAYAPGMIPTEMNHFTERPAQEQEELLSTLTLHRWGRPEDIANLVCFLSSDRASYITGALIDISGGKLATQLPHEAYALSDVNR